MNRTKITIIKPNVNHWHNKRFGIYNAYRPIDQDIILINDTGLTDNVSIIHILQKKTKTTKTVIRPSPSNLTSPYASTITSKLKHDMDQ